jgi:hypothetical protein
MLDQWIFNEIEKHLKNGAPIVLLDPKQWLSFFLPEFEKRGYTVIPTDSNLTKHWEMVREELFLRHKVASQPIDEKVIFYVTRPRSQLSFLFDYCFTHGCLDFTNPMEWIQKKIKKYFPDHPLLENDLLSIAAKESVGKTDQWWKDVLHNPGKIFVYDDEIKSFLLAPDSYMYALDTEKRCKIEDKLFELLQQPAHQKPPSTLATELMYKIFDGLLNDNISPDLFSIYQKLSDSTIFQPKMNEYKAKYQIGSSTDPWQAHPKHCFELLDLKCLEDLLIHLGDKDLYQEKKAYLKKRINAKPANEAIPNWWKDIFVLIEFTPANLNNCSTLKDLIGYYTEHFSPLDTAMRNLFVSLPHEEDGVLKSVFNVYESHNQEFLHSWFEKISEYQSDQQGFLTKLLEIEEPGIAVIVADGFRYELAETLAQAMESSCKIERKVMLAGIPSETEHNMSQLYAQMGELISEKKNREKALKKEVKKDVVFKDLNKANKSLQADYLILSCRDIDTVGESLSIQGSRFFNTILSQVQEKIISLLNSGFRKVYLVTDHGFVLNAFLQISDKIAMNIKGKKEIKDRYFRTEEKQHLPDLLEFQREKGDFRYVYVAKNHRPFVCSGTYGYAHGGISPQEVILPSFCFSSKIDTSTLLEVYFKEKKTMSVTGKHFKVAIKASESNTLYALKRKVLLAFYDGNKELYRSNPIELESSEVFNVEYFFEDQKEMKAILYDANTHEKLDELIIKQTQARDMGGLI